MSDSSKTLGTISPAEEASVIAIWEKTIEVQMHFNDIEMRIRNLFITVILALTGAIGWVLDKEYSLGIYNLQLNFAWLLLLAGMIASYLFLLMDKYWYHRLLKGAIAQATALEKMYGESIPALSLTSKITDLSPIKNFKNSIFGKAASILKLVRVNEDTFSADGKGNDLRSTGKIELFYLSPIRIIQLMLFISALLGGISYKNSSAIEMLLSASS